MKNLSNTTQKSGEREEKLSKLRDVINALEQKRANKTQFSPKPITERAVRLVSPAVVDATQTQPDNNNNTTQNNKCSINKIDLEKLQNEMSEIQNSCAAINPIEKRIDEIARALVVVSNMHSNKINEINYVQNSVERIETRIKDMSEIVDKLDGKNIEQPQKQTTNKKIMLKCFVAIVFLFVVFAYI